jgi:hypothetical protein
MVDIFENSLELRKTSEEIVFQAQCLVTTSEELVAVSKKLREEIMEAGLTASRRRSATKESNFHPLPSPNRQRENAGFRI